MLIPVSMRITANGYVRALQRTIRKAGEMLAAMDKAKGAQGTGSNQHVVRSHDATAAKLSDIVHGFPARVG